MRRSLLAFFVLLSVVVPWATASGAGSSAGSSDRPAAGRPAAAPGRHLEVIQVEGLIDPVVDSLIRGSIRRAQTNGASVVILQVHSSGALDTEPRDIIKALRTSRVPIVTWVGPGRAAARGAAAALVEASYGAASPGARIGPVVPLRLDRPRRSEPDVLAAAGLTPAKARLRLTGQKALAAGLVDLDAPTLGDLIVGLNGKDVATAGGPVHLTTAKVIQTKGGPRQTADEPVRFLKLGAFASVEHSLTSPALSFLLLIVGLSLMVFEFFTIGIGLAGLVGAAAVVGALFGYSHLPVTGWALGLLFLSTFGFSVDVQAGHQGFWTGVGLVGLLTGSLWLFGGSTSLDVPLWLVGLVFVAQVVFMLGGMSVAVRNRFSVPTVGRDSMIGEIGEARTALDPEGVVTVRGAPGGPAPTGTGPSPSVGR